MRLDLTKSPYYRNMAEADYHNNPAWSYSTIAKYARGGFKALETLHDAVEPTPEMKFGSLFDCIMTKGLDAVKKEYAVFYGIYPAPAIKTAIEKMFNSYDYLWDEITDEAKISVLNSLDYQNRWKPETRIASFDTGKEYYEFLDKTRGKTIVSEEDWDDAFEMRNAMYANPYIASIFGKSNDDIEYIYQAKFMLPLLINGNVKADIKFMPDLIIINHTKGQIIPVDLKTSHMPAYEFPEHWLKMRYDIQAGLYTDGLQAVVDNILDLDDESYRIMPYLFVDISRTDKIPLAFMYDPKANNGHLQFKNYSYKNWKELLIEIFNYEVNELRVPSYINEYKSNDILKLLNHEQ